MPDQPLLEISVKGKWMTVPVVRVNDHNVVASGKWIKVAAVHDEAWMEREVEQPSGIIQRLQNSEDFAADVFTFAQKLPETAPRYSYPIEWDSIAAIRTTSFAAWWDKLPQEARKNSRRAAKRGVVMTVRTFDDDLVGQIVQLNNDSPLKQGSPFTHFGKPFELVKKDHCGFEERSDFICAWVGDELVGFLKLVYCGEVGAILQLTTKGSHYDKRPANALVTRAVELCEEKRLSFMTYGKYRYGNQENTSLMEFKSRNGFEEIMVPRYYVPLTLKGKMVMRLGLHRDLVGVLPRPVIALGRRARSKWHKLGLRLRPARPNSRDRNRPTA
jgi:hypothetical protein